jgi:hypothetical protein
MTQKRNGHLLSARNLLIKLAPQVRLELTTLRLTAECSAIELLRNIRPKTNLKIKKLSVGCQVNLTATKSMIRFRFCLRVILASGRLDSPYTFEFAKSEAI